MLESHVEEWFFEHTVSGFSNFERYHYYMKTCVTIDVAGICTAW